MNLVVNGALGKMGRGILTFASADPDITIYGAVDRLCDKTGSDIGELIGIGKIGVSLTSDIGKVLTGAHVVVDFSSPDAVLTTAQVCAENSIPLVEGTTGLSDTNRDEFVRIVSKIPCVFAPNMSVGVNLLFKLVRETAQILGEAYDIEITEVHHRFKKDAPSGTAKRLAEIIADTLKRDLGKTAVYGRKGITGERPQKEIGIHALRAGDVVGEHTVTFATIGERLELTHRAHSRDALAQGALKAAHFVVHAQPGLYDMGDVLGLK